MEKTEETRAYTLDQLDSIPAVIRGFTFFAEEKWEIASDKGGSGNTANIGSITCIEDILAGRGVFSQAGEAYFDDYWTNFGKMLVPDGRGGHKKLSSFAEYLAYRGLPAELNTPRRKRGG